jgi:putative ABC transport system ATP-binding protein
MLRLEAISRTYHGANGPVRALQEVSLELTPGSFLAVQGPSGCGKTTLLLTAGGLLRPDSGRVVLLDRDIYALSHDERARFRGAHIGFVFQQFHLIPYLSVLDNVCAPALAVPRKDAIARAEQLLEHFGLGHRRHHVPAELSTGERQRTALARALFNQPKVLLADEPTGNLDADNGRRVLEYMAEFAQGGGAVLLVTHDPAAAKFAKEVRKMDGGRLSTA